MVKQKTKQCPYCKKEIKVGEYPNISLRWGNHLATHESKKKLDEVYGELLDDDYDRNAKEWRNTRK